MKSVGAPARHRPPTRLSLQRQGTTGHGNADYDSLSVQQVDDKQTGRVILKKGGKEVGTTPEDGVKDGKTLNSEIKMTPRRSRRREQTGVRQPVGANKGRPIALVDAPPFGPVSAPRRWQEVRQPRE